MAFWLPLISAGASLLSGFLGKQGEEERDEENLAAWTASNDRNRRAVESMNADVRARAEAAAALPVITQHSQVGGVDVGGMMAAAEAAGFNPITWLRNGGMQAYSWVKSEDRVWNSMAMDAALAGSTIFQEGSPPQRTARSTGEVLGSAISSGASQWVHEVEQQRQNDFQMAMLNAQLDGAQQRDAMRYGRSGYVPTAIMAGGHTTSTNSAALKLGSMWKQIIQNNPEKPNFGKPVWVLDQDVVPSPDLYISPPLIDYTQNPPPGTPGETPFERAGRLFRESIESYKKTLPVPQGPNAPKSWWDEWNPF